MKEFGKLSDDMLENVSGGTNEEMLDIQNALKAKNLKEIMDGLIGRAMRKKFGFENSAEEYARLYLWML